MPQSPRKKRANPQQRSAPVAPVMDENVEVTVPDPVEVEMVGDINVTPPEQFNDQPVVESNTPPEPVVVQPVAPEPEPVPEPKPLLSTRGEQVRRDMADAARRRRDAQANLLKGGPVPPQSKAPLGQLQRWEIVDLTMNDYLQHMGSTSSIDVKTGAMKQRSLFMLIKSLLLKNNGKDGQNALFYLLNIINEYSGSHFTPLLWGRFISQMSGSESEKQFFRIIMAVMVGLSDPKGRGVYARGIDIGQVIVYASEIESIRGNVVFLQNLRAFLMACTRS